jgi:UDP-N-acetylglucosamine diphosphorylase / glucose-1-phosphate thymidylyltransferase / UDP-N-acetylgalactosamine diphosphorylase / glucosamine-1-phosphate N-acetyltransferase / galactosamine-1-phosphate N-acetyltransferase
MHVVIFEGSHWRTFAPFSLSRPVFSLPCGAGTLLEKQIRATQPTRVTLWVRPELEDYCRRNIIPHLPCPGEVNKPLDNERALVMSGRTLHLSQYNHGDDESVVLDEAEDGTKLTRIALVRSPGLSPDDILNRTDRWLRLKDLPASPGQSRLPEYVWDLIKWNEEAIVADSIAMTEASEPLPTGPYHAVEESNISLGKNVHLGPGCVLDASKGPIVLAENVNIGANSVIQGPVYLGPHTQITPLSLIRAGTSMGPMCKLGGEVSNAVILGFTNKPHDGFLGDSYLGEWVNLGAGSTTSNLKNTYGEVAMPVDGREVKTGRRFMGSLIGDHTKCAIGTTLMTGSYVGFGCMVGTSHYPPRFIPSFTFLTDRGPEPYRMEKLVEMAKYVFIRRERVFNESDEQMMHYVREVAPSVEKPASS